MTILNFNNIFKELYIFVFKMSLKACGILPREVIVDLVHKFH